MKTIGRQQNALATKLLGVLGHVREQSKIANKQRKKKTKTFSSFQNRLEFSAGLE